MGFGGFGWEGLWVTKGQWPSEDGTAGLTGPVVLFGFGVGMLGRGLNKLQSESLFEGRRRGHVFRLKRVCRLAC